MSATLEQLLRLAQLQIASLKAREQVGAEAFRKLEAERDRWMRTATTRGKEIIGLRAGRLLTGVLVRAGTFTAGNEEVTGFVIACSPADLAALPRLPMYRQVETFEVAEPTIQPHPTIPEAQATS